MLFPHSMPLHGISWKNSGLLTSRSWTPLCRTAILFSILLTDYLPTYSVPSFFPLTSRSLPILSGPPTSKKTISMPSFPAFSSRIPRVPALFTISWGTCGPLTRITFPIPPSPEGKAQKAGSEGRQSSC